MPLPWPILLHEIGYFFFTRFDLIGVVCVFIVRGTVSLQNLSQRAIEDYAVVYFGSSLFKILRLLIIAIFSIHLFACIFYRVKEISAYSPDDVTDFYGSRLSNDDVGFSSVYHPF